MHSIAIALLTLLTVHFPFVISQDVQFNFTTSCLEWGFKSFPADCVPDFPAGPDLPVGPGAVLPNQKPNHWKVEQLSVSMSDGPSANISGVFVLSRSIWTPCDENWLRLYAPITPHICWWQISQDPVFCYAGPHRAGEWQSCQQFTRRAEGEREISTEMKKRLRWRFVDREDHTQTDQIPGATPSTIVPLVKLNTTITQLQISYGVPLNESRGRLQLSSDITERSIVAYSTKLDFPSDRTSCSKGGGYPNMRWSCALNGAPKSTCKPLLGILPGLSACYAELNVTEEIIPSTEFTKRYS